MKRSALALSASILLVALLPGSAMAAAVVDQSNNPSGTPAPTIGTPGDIAQTFTAGKTGLLTEVDLYMNGTGTYPVRIESTTGAGLPAGDNLGGGLGTPVNPEGWVSFVLGSPVAVTAGQVYAIVFNTGNTAAAWGSGDTYAGGQALIVNGVWMSMQAWLPSSLLYDFAFKTFVDPQTTKLQWDKSQVVAGSTTPLTLTETVVFPAAAQIGLPAAKPDVFVGQTWSVKSDALPAWFTLTGVACSAQIATLDCTLANVAPGSSLGVTPDGNPITLTLTGTASPALAAVGTGTGRAEGCVDYNELVLDVVPAAIVTSCVADQAIVAVVAPAATPTPPAATPPPTTTGGSRSPNDPSSSTLLLTLGLTGFAGVSLMLVNRGQRRIR